MDEYHDYRIFQELSLLLDHADRIVLRQFNLNTLQYNALLLLNTNEGWRLTDLSERLIRDSRYLGFLLRSKNATG